VFGFTCLTHSVPQLSFTQLCFQPTRGNTLSLGQHCIAYGADVRVCKVCCAGWSGCWHCCFQCILWTHAILCCVTRRSMVPFIMLTRMYMSRPWLTHKRSMPCCSMHKTLPSISLTAVTQCCRIGAKLLLTTHNIGVIPSLSWYIINYQSCLMSSSVDSVCMSRANSPNLCMSSAPAVADDLPDVACCSGPSPPALMK
jgi:hypothetical protein